MNTLVIDAYDSFVYIIYQYLLTLNLQVDIVRNDKITLEAIADKAPDFIVLGPGPGHPQAAHYLEIIAKFAGEIPIMGVCLGHQAIGLAYGGRVIQAKHLMHGKTSMIEHDGKGCFSTDNIENPFQATRYHSLIIDENNFPEQLVITARDLTDQYIMGLRHKHLPIESVQFHPESIYTDNGLNLFKNFIKTYL